MNNIEMRHKLLLLIAVGCGALAVVLTVSYVNSERDKVARQMEKLRQAEANMKNSVTPEREISVLVALKDIPVETMVTSEYLGIKKIPEQYVQDGVYTAQDNILGKTAKAQIFAGEQITRKKVGDAEKVKLVSEMTPAGKRAVPLTVDNMAAIAGMLHQGDYVDVLAMISPPSSSSLYALSGDSTAGKSSDPKVLTIPLFQNVLILSVGSEANGKKRSGAPENSVTVSLTPQEAALASFVQEQGKIRILMRSNSDFDQATIKPVNWDSLFEYLYPHARDGVKPPATVEIYRGLRKEIISLSEGKK